MITMDSSIVRSVMQGAKWDEPNQMDAMRLRLILRWLLIAGMAAADVVRIFTELQKALDILGADFLCAA